MRDLHFHGFSAPFGERCGLGYGGSQRPIDHIWYSEYSGFGGITPKDKEAWLRRYPNIRDFDTVVAEAKGWLSKRWDRQRRAKERPRELLDRWLAGDWMAVAGNREPETIYNPGKLNEYVEEYFKADELIECLTRGRHDGFADSLARQHYDRVLGHAVKLRGIVPDFPKAPETTENPRIDLRRFQEWCVECDEIVTGLYAKVARADVERALALLRELADLLESGFPTMDKAAESKCRAEVRDEVERLLKVLEELGEPSVALSAIPSRDLRSKAKRWSRSVSSGQECEPLLAKMREQGLHIPEERAVLTEMLFAAELMAGVDWDRIREMTEADKGVSAESIPIERLAAQRKILVSAQMAERSIGLLTWTRYRQKNPEYDKAVREATQGMGNLYNEFAEALQANQLLLQVATLREDKLCQAVKRLYRRLFEDSGATFDDSDPLLDIAEELEAIGACLNDDPEEGNSGEPDAKSIAGRAGRPREHSDEKLHLASAAFDKFRLDCADDKEAWSKVADFYEFPTWTAARQACRRYTQQQNKTQN